MLSATVAAIGLVTPGMENWREGVGVLRGDIAYGPRPLSKHKLELLPANERRRATPLIQLALRAIEDCLSSATASKAAPAPGYERLASVFACSGGDMGNLHASCEQLAKDPKGVSPTTFHNSVHNAVAGYWSIGGHARATSISICAHDASFVAGLLEAFALLTESAAPVLYVAYDMAVPLPLFNKRPVTPDFAVALLLDPVREAAREVVTIESVDHFHTETATYPIQTVLAHAALETLRLGNPAARALPVLQLLAGATSGNVLLADDEVCWQVGYAP